jgi:hypothetical protein
MGYYNLNLDRRFSDSLFLYQLIVNVLRYVFKIRCIDFLCVVHAFLLCKMNSLLFSDLVLSCALLLFLALPF